MTMTLDLSRRSFIGGLLAAIAAPAVVKAEILMPVRGLILPVYDHDWAVKFDIYRHRFEAWPLPDEGQPLRRILPDGFRVLSGEARAHLNRMLSPRMCSQKPPVWAQVSPSIVERTFEQHVFSLSHEEMGLPDCGSLVPQRRIFGGNGREVADLGAAARVQNAISPIGRYDPDAEYEAARNDPPPRSWEDDSCGD